MTIQRRAGYGWTGGQSGGGTLSLGTITGTTAGDSVLLWFRDYPFSGADSDISSLTVGGQAATYTGKFASNGQNNWFAFVAALSSGGNKAVEVTLTRTPANSGNYQVDALLLYDDAGATLEMVTSNLVQAVNPSGAQTLTTIGDNSAIWSVAVAFNGTPTISTAGYTTQAVVSNWNFEDTGYDLDVGTAGAKSVEHIAIATHTQFSVEVRRVAAAGPSGKLRYRHAYGSVPFGSRGWLGDVAAGGPITVVLGTALETDAAQLLTRLKRRALAAATSTDAAQPFARLKSRTLAPATEADAAQALTRIKQRALGAAPESDAAQPLGRQKLRALGFLFGTETAQPIGRTKVRALGVATETDSALPISTGTGGPLIGSVGTALETDVAQLIGRAKLRALAVAGEADAAIALAQLKVRATGSVATAEGAQAITPRKLRALLVAASTEAAQALGRIKSRTLGTVVESSAAQAITATGGSPPPAADPSAALRTIRIRRRP